MYDLVNDDDLQFVRELVADTQGNKVDWAVDDDSFTAKRRRTGVTLSREGVGSGGLRSIRLVIARRDLQGVTRTLGQQLTDAAPAPAQLALNSMLAFLWQLIADRNSPVTNLYDDWRADGENS